LEEWLNNMTSRVNEKQLDSQSHFMNIQMIYTACLKELIRQISIHCSERGALLQKIWDDYLELVEKAIIYERKKNTKIENEQINEITKIHSLYQTEINNLSVGYNKSLEMHEAIKHNFEKSNAEKMYALKRLALVKRKTSNIEESYFSLKKEYDKILSENYNLKIIADENLLPDSPLKLKISKNPKIIDPSPSPSLVDLQNSKPFGKSSTKGTSIVSHLLEHKENQTMFSRKEMIETRNDKKSQSSLNMMPVPEITIPLKNNETNQAMDGQKVNEIDENYDDLEVFELEDTGVDTCDLYKFQDKETNTDFIDIIKEDDEKGENKNNEITDEDYTTIKEDSLALEEIIEEINANDSQKDNVRNFIIKIKSKAKILVSKHNKMNFVVQELMNLKEENTKLKIEISELIIERDQLKDLDNNRQADMMEWLKQFDKVRNENKVIKRSMKEFQNSVENSNNNFCL